MNGSDAAFADWRARWTPAGSDREQTPSRSRSTDIHRVVNAGRGTAISLHVYGADLRLRTTGIRRRYDLPMGARR